MKFKGGNFKVSSNNSREEFFLYGALQKGLDVKGKEKVKKTPTTCFNF